MKPWQPFRSNRPKEGANSSFCESKGADKSEIKFDNYRISKKILQAHPDLTGWAFFCASSFHDCANSSFRGTVHFILGLMRRTRQVLWFSNLCKGVFHGFKIKNDVQKFYPAGDCGS